MHDDNTAMIQVCRTGRNPTMRTLGRVHGISINTMHEALFRQDFRVGPIGTKSMCADIHTKAFPEHKATEWFHVRQNAGVYSPAELLERIGTAGPGWVNYREMPGKYHQRRLETVSEEPFGPSPTLDACPAETQYGQGWQRSNGPK